MCHTPPNWSPDLKVAADTLLDELIEQNRTITSLDFKLSLRKIMGTSVPILQADVSQYLRSWYELVGNGQYQSRVDRSDQSAQPHIVYESKSAAANQASIESLVKSPEKSATDILTGAIGRAAGLSLTELEAEFAAEQHRRVLAAMAATNGNQSRASKLLCITRYRLRRLLKVAK